jgi:hypothetical protein
MRWQLGRILRLSRYSLQHSNKQQASNDYQRQMIRPSGAGTLTKKFALAVGRDGAALTVFAAAQETIHRLLIVWGTCASKNRSTAWLLMLSVQGDLAAVVVLAAWQKRNCQVTCIREVKLCKPHSSIHG